LQNLELFSLSGSCSNGEADFGMKPIPVGKYYQTRKQQAAMGKEKTPITITTSITATAVTAIHNQFTALPHFSQ
jgi:hypothetical protein